MPVRRFGKRRAPLQISQSRFDHRARFLLTLLVVNVSDDMGSPKHRRTAEVVLLRMIERLDIFGRRQRRFGGDVTGGPLQARIPLDQPPDPFLITRASAVSHGSLLLQLPLNGNRIDGPGIACGGPLEERHIDGRELGGGPKPSRPFDFIGKLLPPRVTAKLRLLRAHCLLSYRLAIDEVRHKLYCVRLSSTVTPPLESGATRSGRPGDCPCRLWAKT